MLFLKNKTAPVETRAIQLLIAYEKDVLNILLFIHYSKPSDQNNQQHWEHNGKPQATIPNQHSGYANWVVIEITGNIPDEFHC
jgi:hypothetical protein